MDQCESDSRALLPSTAAFVLPSSNVKLAFLFVSLLRSSVQEEFSTVNYTTKTPLGVAGLITPWNLPLYLLTWKVGVFDRVWVTFSEHSFLPY